MQNKTKLHHDLLDIIDKQDEIIHNQNELIARLINENLEKENIVNTLMRQEEYLY